MKAIPKKIIWLASYPKSGNTWFRSFISFLLNGESDDLNAIKTDGIFSARSLFDQYTDLDSTGLYHDEVKLLLPDVFNTIALHCKKEQLFIKIHDAFTVNKAARPIVPAECTRCAIYFIRNPLDVAGSLAAFMNTSIGNAIGLLNNEQGSLAQQKGNLNIYEHNAILLQDWTSHVIGWTTKPSFPVMVIRYEDMLDDPYNAFKNALKFMDIHAANEQINTAIDASSFKKLQKKEEQGGFLEKSRFNIPFFRKGTRDNWKTELTKEQILMIRAKHHRIMKQYDYL